MRGEVVVPRGMKPEVARSRGEAPGGMGMGMGVAGRRMGRVRMRRIGRRRESSIVLVREWWFGPRERRGRLVWVRFRDLLRCRSSCQHRSKAGR